MFLYASPSRRRSQTSQHKLCLLWKVDLFLHWQRIIVRIDNELLQINKINCNFLATDWAVHIWWLIVQSLSPVQLCDPVNCSTPGFPVSHCLLSLLKLMSIESLMPSNYFILCCPILLLPSAFPSIRVFSNDLALHIRKAKYWSFIFSISLPMNIQDWFPLGWTGLISLQSKGLSRVLSSTTIQKHHLFRAQPSFGLTLT